MNSKQKVLFIGILVVAAFFRFHKLVDVVRNTDCGISVCSADKVSVVADMPGGLFPDEAAEGLDVHLIEQGHLQPFYERGNGREALFYYLLVLVDFPFKPGAWQLHLGAAIIGFFSVLVCYFVTRRLFLIGENSEEPAARNRAINIALLSTFLMAVSTWHTVLSRTAFRANLIPLFAGLTFLCLIITYQSKTLKNQLFHAFLTGAVFALGFYSYIAYRILVMIIAVLVLWPLIAYYKDSFGQNIFQRYWKHAIWFFVGFFIFIFPIGRYFVQHPGSFVGRSGQVSVFNPEQYLVNGIQLHGKPPITTVLSVIAETAKLSVYGYFTHGDLNWRHNVSGQPFLSPIISPFFGVGLLLVTLMASVYLFMPRKKSGWWKYCLLAGWFWGMLVPVVTTAEGIPHGLRSIGTIPVVFIITAWLLYEISILVLAFHKRICERWCKPNTSVNQLSVSGGVTIEEQSQVMDYGWRYRWILTAFKLVLVCFCLALILQSYLIYFVYAYNSPENFYAFRSDLTPVSQYLIDHGSKEHTYLVLDKFSVQTPEYITMVDVLHPNNPKNQPYTQVDPEDSWKISALKSGDEVVFTQSSIFDIKKFKQYHPKAKLAIEERNKFGQAVMAVYRVE